MAGRTKKNGGKYDDPKTVTELYDLLEIAESELNRLRPIVLNINPDALTKGLPDLITEPNDDTFKMMIAAGIAGLTPAEIRTQCGITSEMHTQWMKTNPAYKTAFGRARDAAYMKQMQRIRLAVGSKDWKFPFANAVKMLAVMMESDENGKDIGDASHLIVLDTTA